MANETLGDNADIVMGQSPPGSSVSASPNGLPLLNGPTEFGSHHPTPVQFTTDVRKRALPGDILFCVRGSTTGRMNWADQEYAIGRGIAAIRHRKISTLQPLVRAVIENGLEGLLAQATGSTFPNVSASQLSALPYPTLEEAEQLAIAHILGSLDDKIELNRRMNTALEAMARAIFKSWFVDFDLVRAKAEGSDPSLPDEIAALFPDSFEDSELGPIPRGWEPGALGDIAANLRRGVKPDQIPPTTPYIGLQHMPRRCIALDTWGRADEVGSQKSQFKEGDVLFGKLRPYFHKVGIAAVDGVCSTDILVVVPKAEYWHSYMLSLVSSNAFVDYTDSHSAGTKMPRTNWKDMSRYLLALPPVELASAFQNHVAALHQRIAVSVRQNRSLAGLRDTLLPKLLSGELKVPDAEKLMGGIG